MDSVIEPIVRAPRMLEYVGELNRICEQEREWHERFWNEITEEQKAEFINGEVVVHSPARAAHLSATRSLVALMHAYVAPRTSSA